MLGSHNAASFLRSWDFGGLASAIGLVGCIFFLGLYTISFRYQRKLGYKWQFRRLLYAILGVMTLLIALDGPIGSFDDSSFTDHVIQHIFLMMFAPALFALSAPATLFLRSLRKEKKLFLLKLLNSKAVKFLSNPIVSGSLYYGSMYFMFLTTFYAYMENHSVVHNITHAVIFTVGCIFWWPILGLDSFAGKPKYPARIVLLFVGMPLEVFLGIALITKTKTIYPLNSLNDTHNGGAIFWIISMLMSGIVALALVFMWMKSEERLSQRSDKKLDDLEEFSGDTVDYQVALNYKYSMLAKQVSNKRKV